MSIKVHSSGAKYYTISPLVYFTPLLVIRYLRKDYKFSQKILKVTYPGDLHVSKCHEAVLRT